MNKNKAFTLIEMLVAVTIFTLVVGSTAGLFIAGIRSQARALVSQKLLDETGFVMEKMSRALRVAKKDTAGTCISTNFNYQNLGGIASITFINSQGVCQEFRLNTGTGQLEEYRGGSLFGVLTSNNLEVSSLIFDLSGESQADNLQPRVTILLKIKNANAAKPEMTIQTTISQRNLDILQ